MSKSVTETYEKTILLLSELGLNTSQARAYLTFAQSNNLSAKDLSMRSRIARQDIYNILFCLEKTGLVIAIPDQPKQFRAVPIDEGLSTLIWRRVKRTAELKEQALASVRAFREQNREEDLNEKKEFMVFPKRETLNNKASRMGADARE